VALLGWGCPPKNEVTYNKGTFTYLSGMVVAESLLVPSRSHDGDVPLFLKHVIVSLALLLGPLLIVEEDTGGDQVQVKGDDHLGPIYEEEGHAPIQTVHTRPQASEQGGEFIHPMASVDLKLIVDTGFDPLNG
jgi:hypothetical protein